jgi:hypothetical protein
MRSPPKKWARNSKKKETTKEIEKINKDSNRREMLEMFFK